MRHKCCNSIFRAHYLFHFFGGRCANEKGAKKNNGNMRKHGGGRDSEREPGGHSSREASAGEPGRKGRRPGPSRTVPMVTCPSRPVPARKYYSAVRSILSMLCRCVPNQNIVRSLIIASFIRPGPGRTVKSLFWSEKNVNLRVAFTFLTAHVFELGSHDARSPFSVC